MRVFLDTNILLDIIEERQEFLADSANVFDLGIKGQIQMFASPLTFVNCVYIAKKNVGYHNAMQGIKLLKQFVVATTMDDRQVTYALQENVPDFEDRLQFEAAIAAQCDVIVTRDTKRHFPHDRIPILTPIEFLSAFQPQLRNNTKEFQ